MTYVENSRLNYSDLLPKLISLVLSQYPQLFNITTMLIEEEQKNRFLYKILYENS